MTNLKKSPHFYAFIKVVCMKKINFGNIGMKWEIFTSMIGVVTHAIPN